MNDVTPSRTSYKQTEPLIKKRTDALCLGSLQLERNAYLQNEVVII
jgi:hypothetical protein